MIDGIKMIIEEGVDGSMAVTARFTKDIFVEYGQEAVYKEILRRVTDEYLKEHQDEIVAHIDMERLGKQINGKVLGAALKQLAKDA